MRAPRHARGGARARPRALVGGAPRPSAPVLDPRRARPRTARRSPGPQCTPRCSRTGPARACGPIGQGRKEPAAPSRLLVPRGSGSCAYPRADGVGAVAPARGRCAARARRRAAAAGRAAPRRAGVAARRARAGARPRRARQQASPAITGAGAALARAHGAGRTGCWSLTLAEPLLGRRLWLGAPAGTPTRACRRARSARPPRASSAPRWAFVLLGAALWAGAALYCPGSYASGRRAST